jgi:hypothetical protein
MSRRLCLLLLSLTVLALLTAVPAAAHRDKGPEVVATGLDNPRGLDVDHHGSIYVTEAGRGGAGPCMPGPEGGEVCIGASGAVTKAWHGGQRRIVDGLPSVAGADGNGAIGPSDVELRWWGSALLTVGLAADPSARAGFGELGAGLGQLYKLSHRGPEPVADIAQFEADANPDGTLPPDSNPHSVTTKWGRTYVADAGGNTIVKVRKSGEISTVAVFPDRIVDAPPGFPEPQVPMQAVPTSVVVGPDGALYVGQLTGFPFVEGGANVYRIGRDGQPEVYASGFTNVTGIAFDRHGRLYVVEFASNGILSMDPTGALIRVDPDGSRETIADDLVNPTGVAVSRKGNVYVSNHGAEAGLGEVLRFRQ